MIEQVVTYLLGLLHLSPVLAAVISAGLFFASEAIGAFPKINGSGVGSLIKNMLIAAAKAIKSPPAEAPKV